MKELFSISFSKLIRNWDWGIIAAGVSAVISFIFDSTVLLYALTAIVIIDAVTGMIASKKRKQPICSDVFRWKTFVKLLAYLAILLVAATVDLAVEIMGLTDHSLIHALAIGWIVLVEGVSVLENTEVILGHKIPLLRRLKKMLTEVEEQTEGEEDVR
jgi:phage-related holin